MGTAVLENFWPADLRRFRSYKGTSVRDLLRAMRNKVCSRASGLGKALGVRQTRPWLSQDSVLSNPRNTTTGSSPQRCSRRWARSLTASCNTSQAASPACCCTRTGPCAAVLPKAFSRPITHQPQRSGSHAQGLPGADASQRTEAASVPLGPRVEPVVDAGPTVQKGWQGLLDNLGLLK